MPSVKNVISLFLLFFQTTIAANASLPALSRAKRDQIPYFKSKTSQFASGFATREKLGEQLLSTAEELVKTEGDHYVYGEKKIGAHLLRPTFAHELNLKSGHGDIGKFLTLVGTVLRDRPHLKSKAVAGISAQTLLVPIGHENGFIKVIHQGRRGFVDISACLSKLDFAYAIYGPHPRTKVKQWHYIKSRIFDQIELMDLSQIPISRIEGLIVNDNMGIVSRTNDGLPLWSKVVLAKEKKITETWAQSYVTGDGLVWWKVAAPPESGTDPLNSEILSIDDILKKEIYSVSFHPQNPKKAIASISSGVFMTENGTRWKPVKQFKNFRGPVFYYNDNLIFVGSYRSINLGASFDQFIDVGTLSAAIAGKLGHPANYVKIKKIRSTRPSRIAIDVDTGHRILKLESAVYGQNWEFVRN